MADIAAWRPAELAVFLRLEWQQAEHMVDIAEHGPRPSRPPGPELWRDVIDDRDRRIARPHAAGDTVGEVGAVDDDERVRRGFGHGLRGLADQPQDLRQLLHDRGEAHDRELLDRKQRLQPLARHGVAADAHELHAVAEPLAQHLHQGAAEPVAGFLRGDQEDLALGIATLHHAGRPMTKRYLASASAIIACGSATMVLPATTAMPASPAAATPSRVHGPIVGRSKRRSCPLFGTFTSTPRPVAPRCRPLRAAGPRPRAAHPCPPCPRPPPQCPPSTPPPCRCPTDPTPAATRPPAR